tara:strand:+ start:344 stop:604 length:261 start_codon:yes stop_codon:yes gene_type:complete
MFSNILKDRARVHECYSSVFSSAEGQVVVNHLMRKFNVTSSSFIQGDPNATAFAEGQRHVVLSILKFISKDANDIANMIKGHIDDE